MSDEVKVLPEDEFNKTLVDNVHPSDWVNPEPAEKYNLVAIGAGAAGLISVAGGAGLGGKTAIIEKELMGGDCLNVGCVPSKGVIRAARAAAEIRDAGEYGIFVPPGVTVHFHKVMERMRKLRAQIAPNDSAKKFRDLGVDVFLGDGKFTGPNTIEVGGKTLHFVKAVIATGGRPNPPPIPGLADVNYLTNRNLFELIELPERLIVIGGGPIGVEMGQSFLRFGSDVTLLDIGKHILPREDADAAEIVQQQFVKEGMNLKLGIKILNVAQNGDEKVVTIEIDGKQEEVIGDEILVAVGRAPNVEGLNLEKVGVQYDKRGVHVNDRLQTTNPNIYAAGDVCSKYQFTHTADANARIVIGNSLFGGRGKVSALTIPWCTYTEPEIAHVGMYESDGPEHGIGITTFTHQLDDNDRSILEGDTSGFVKIHVEEGTDKIVGATIVAKHAGEMINELTLAIKAGVGLGTIADTIHPYPTQAEAVRSAAGAYNRTRLTPRVAGLMKKWLKFTRR